MKSKKAMLVFPNNVIFCYDLIMLDIINNLKNKIKPEDRQILIDSTLDAFNAAPAETPLHKLVFKNDKLILVDIMTNIESSYSSKNKFIYAKSRFITLGVYDKLVNMGYRDLVPIARVTHKNICCDRLMDQYNNFIVYDNRNWDEFSMLYGMLGGDKDQYIDRDKIVDWFEQNIDPDDNGFLELTIVSDAFDVDRELAAETFQKIGLKCRFVKTELRICNMNYENMRRYNESDKSMMFNRSSIGLYKLWDQNNFG